MNHLAAYLLSMVGGAIVVGVLMKAIHVTVGDPARPGFHPLHWWVGCVERGIATTLFVWAPKQLPLFIGGWVAAKLAAGWSRRTDEHAANGHFIALVGNAFSFSIAIAVGLWLSPASLDTLNSEP